MIRKKMLPYIFLLVTMLLVSFNAFAHEVQSGAAQDRCTCHPVDHAPVEKGGQPDHAPDSSGEHCCGCEACCPDATGPAVFTGLRVAFSVEKNTQPHPDNFFPLVYLTIFVPPENSSLI